MNLINSLLISIFESHSYITTSLSLSNPLNINLSFI